MKILTLKLSNFRNYEKLKLIFNDNLNIFYGNNGIGKTNLVEAIYVLSLTKSFRTNNDRNLIKDGEISTKIEGEVETNTTNEYEVVINKEGKKVKIDNNVVSKLSEYISKINIVLLEADEQIIFEESPSERRKLLNIELCNIKNDYIIYLNNYNKILKQRNFYLKELYLNSNGSLEYLDILTKKLIEYGKKIYDYRKEFIDNINKYISDKYKSIFEYGDIFIKYNSDYTKNEDEIFNYYKINYNKELNLGKTLYGIHHDDIIFQLNKKDIAIWGSNGQKKNAIIAFKLALIELIYAEKGSYPILILDDLFSALDNLKVKNIIKILSDNIQTFITTTDLEKIDNSLLEKADIFDIGNCGVFNE